MYLGNCVEKATADALFEKPLHPYTKGLLDSIPVPNLKRRGIENILRGEVTSPINPKPGCRFAARCPYVKPECVEKELPLKEVEPDHFVACALF